MMKSKPTEKQLAARKAAGERLKAMHKQRKASESKLENQTNADPQEDPVEHISEDQSLDDLKRQMNEVMETNTLLKAALLGNQNSSNSVGIGRGNKLVGEVDKYLVDPNNYPNPIERLRREARLAPLAFDYNYELDYRMDIVSYETKTGVNMREPKFHLSLNRVVLDDQGNQTDKRYIARRLVFHEDPQAAIVIARENGLPIDETNEKLFLDEMRYLRVRDWLFGIFWPKSTQEPSQVREEVIGGTIVQVFTRNSEESSGVDFDKLDTKISV